MLGLSLFFEINPVNETSKCHNPLMTATLFSRNPPQSFNLQIHTLSCKGNMSTMLTLIATPKKNSHRKATIVTINSALLRSHLLSTR